MIRCIKIDAIEEVRDPDAEHTRELVQLARGNTVQARFILLVLLVCDLDRSCHGCLTEAELSPPGPQTRPDDFADPQLPLRVLMASRC